MASGRHKYFTTPTPFILSPTPHMQKKYPWRAAAESVGMNVGVWAFDRYVMNEDFAKISINSIRRNIKHGFVGQ